MKVLVTGGAGYIGSVASEHLVKAGHEVVVFDNLSQGHRAAVPDEAMLYWLEQTRGLRYACLRYFNAAGATAERGEDHDPEMHLIPLVLGVALGKRESVTVFGDDYPTRDGTCVRDYIHVSDLATAH